MFKVKIGSSLSSELGSTDEFVDHVELILQLLLAFSHLD